MARTKKPTREDLEREIARLKPYADVLAYRHNHGKNPPATRTEVITAWGGRTRVTVNFYGYWRSDGGVVEVIAQPLKDNNDDGDAPVIECYAWHWIWDRVGPYATTAADPYTAPWGWLIRWVLTDGLRLQNEKNDRDAEIWRAVDAKAEAVRDRVHQVTICYRIHQVTPEDPSWVSCVFEGRDERNVRQNVIAGYLNGQPRWATEEGTDRFLFGIDGKGRDCKSLAEMSLSIATATAHAMRDAEGV